MFTSVLMLFAFVLTVAGLWLDSRIVTGAPVWMKPAKFAISSAIFTASMAWLFGYIEIWPQFQAFAKWGISAVLILENAIIVFQAARGTTSHFNVSTQLNAALWGTMGTAIGILWLITIGIDIALFRQTFADPSWGWTLRLAMLITVLGSGLGAMMTQPTPGQRAELQRHERPAAIGAHTVGAPDGGPGLPFVGWSRNHGDLRIPHFLGLHAIQLLPLICWLFARRNTELVFAASAGYLAIMTILLLQALRGQPML